MLANAVQQSTSMLNVTPSSRASSLPQWIDVPPDGLQVAVTQRTQCTLVVGPAALHLDPQVEHDLGVEQQLHVLARFGADAFDALALVANDDLLLTVTLNEDQGVDVQGFALLLELFDLDGDLVRQLRTHLAHDLFANQLAARKRLLRSVI